MMCGSAQLWIGHKTPVEIEITELGLDQKQRAHHELGEQQ